MKGIYGSGKLAGENQVRDKWRKHVILRTAWVFSEFGTNFLKTILRLGCKRDEVGVVNDQLGCPTDALALADTILEISIQVIHEGADQWGTYHACGAQNASWHKFARDIFIQADQLGLKTPVLRAITGAEFPTPVKRPANSVLDCSKLHRTWNLKVDDYSSRLPDIIKTVSTS